MAIQVKNESAQEIDVAINQWGDDGATNFFRVTPNGPAESWGRSDERGFVMVVRKRGSQLPYYVEHDSDITVFDEHVADRGSVINPIS